MTLTSFAFVLLNRYQHLLEISQKEAVCVGWRVSFRSKCTAAATCIFLAWKELRFHRSLLCSSKLRSAVSMALYIYHVWQLLFENSVSYRKFYNEEVLRFLKKEREEQLFDDCHTP